MAVVFQVTFEYRAKCRQRATGGGQPRPIFESMRWMDSFNVQQLSKKPPVQRERSGRTLHATRRLGLVHLAETQAEQDRINRLARSLQQEFGIELLVQLNWLDGKPGEAPKWMGSDVVFRTDLSFRGRPAGAAEPFLRAELDLLINLEGELPLALMHVVRESRAEMKVAVRQPLRNEDYDVLFEPVEGEGRTERTQRILAFLANTKLT